MDSSHDEDQPKQEDTNDNIDEIKAIADAVDKQLSKKEKLEINFATMELDDQQKIHEATADLQKEIRMFYESVLEDILQKLKENEKNTIKHQKKGKEGPIYRAEEKLKALVDAKDSSYLGKTNILKLRVENKTILDDVEFFSKIFNECDKMGTQVDEKKLNRNELSSLLGKNLFNQYRAIVGLNKIIPYNEELKNIIEIEPKFQKINLFAKTFGQFNDKGVFNHDLKGKKFAKAALHILATIFSAGIYAGLRAGYSKKFGTGSWRFWKSRDELIGTQLKDTQETQAKVARDNPLKKN